MFEGQAPGSPGLHQDRGHALLHREIAVGETGLAIVEDGARVDANRLLAQRSDHRGNCGVAGSAHATSGACLRLHRLDEARRLVRGMELMEIHEQVRPPLAHGLHDGARLRLRLREPVAVEIHVARVTPLVLLDAIHVEHRHDQEGDPAQDLELRWIFRGGILLQEPHHAFGAGGLIPMLPAQDEYAPGAVLPRWRRRYGCLDGGRCFIHRIQRQREHGGLGRVALGSVHARLRCRCCGSLCRLLRRLLYIVGTLGVFHGRGAQDRHQNRLSFERRAELDNAHLGAARRRGRRAQLLERGDHI